MATPPFLVEATRDLVVDHIKTNINQALTDVRGAWTDAAVTTEPPRS